MKEFLLLTFGSYGDVNPFVGIGTALKGRGHKVRLATNPYFEDLVRRAGLEFIPIGTVEEFRATLDHPDLWHPRRGLRFVIEEGMKPLLGPSYEIAKSFAEETRGTVLASMLALGARIAQEKHGVRLVTVHLQPEAFASLDDTPVYPGADISRWPRWAKRLAYRLSDILVDRMLAPDFNALRRKLGLSPIHAIFREWVHSPLLTLGLWPEWFAPPQSDWPAQAQLTGFPLYDAQGVDTLPLDLESFLGEGPAPVVFTPGSAMRQGASFFAESARACREIGCRGVLLTKFPEQVPQDLPPSVRVFGYVPFSQVLPRAAVFVHHGGIGTTAQALACGVPQLVMPLTHDQPDNAARALKLGVALQIKPPKYKAERITPLLKELLNNQAYHARCQAIKSRFAGTNPVEETCRLVESIS